MARETNMAREMSVPRELSMSNHRGGHLYMQTNEIRNCVVHYRWSASGTLTEVERMSTGGAGSGVFKPISGQESAPNAFEGAHNVMLTPDRQFLFAPKGDHGAAGYDHGLVRSAQADGPSRNRPAVGTGAYGA